MAEDKRCPLYTVHNDHDWSRRKDLDAPMRADDNPLEWWHCTGVKPAEVYHRTRIITPDESVPNADIYWECSCGEKGTAADQSFAVLAADAHTEMFKPVGPQDHTVGLFSQWRHKYHFLQVIGVDSRDAVIPDVRDESHLGDANLVSSEIAVGEHAGKHTVAIDLDVPAVLVPSSTPGHSHLYIDVPMSWVQYENLLKALASAGIVEGGYVAACIRRKHTSLRLPWIRKGLAPTPGVDVNAPCVGCYICGDKDDHHGQRHSLATGDGRQRRDTTGPAVPYTNLPKEPPF